MLNAPPSSPSSKLGCCAIRRTPPRPPQEIYFESRGKCCKKLLRYNGYPNKVSGYECFCSMTYMFKFFSLLLPQGATHIFKKLNIYFNNTI